MKCIKHEDLCKLLQSLGATKSWDISDFKRLLDMYGDDYFVEGEEWTFCQRNANMEKFLKELNING